MKNLTFFIAAILLGATVFAQAPQSFRYQAVARDNSGNVLTNLDISFRISILSGSVTGSIVYSETHSGKTTNAFGLVELEIGKGTPVNGTFSTINWGNNSYYVKVEMAPAGGTAYQVLSTSQLLSVPYALHASTAVNATNVTGLEKITEGTNTGWRLIGQNPDQYGNIGQGAVDLSMNSDTFEGATGNFSVAMGTSTHAYANYSTTMGVHTYASGNASTAMGSGTTASGSNSTAMGANTTASGNFSTAIGYRTKAASYASMTIGKYNIGSGNPTSWVATDPLFEIGIGTSATSLANALTVLKNGNTSIGVNSPGSHKLYVKSSTGGVKGSTAFVENSSSTGLAMIVENTSASSTDNTLLVTTHGTGDIVSFDTYQGTNKWNRRFKFTNAGNGRCDGSWIGGGADYAEFFPKANNNAQYEPGDVIAISPEIGYSVESANTDNPNLIIGVYSTNPVVIGNSSAEEDPKNHVLVGLMGVVPTKVNLENGPIKIGDFLTISSTPGVAMKAVKSGYMIGRAMESYSNGSQGKIKVLVESEWMDLEGELDALKKDNEVLKNTLNALKTEFDARLKHVEQTLNTAQQ